ncbi:hypothetical protein ACFL6Y_08510 [Elusimicrobiota bacterium]
MSLLDSPHDFDLFATSGWDGNWYVGYDAMWIIKVPSAPADTEWARAYIGARLGRAKTRVKEEEKEVPGQGIKKIKTRTKIPCDIYMAIADKPEWKASDNYYLTACEDIPQEGDSAEAISGTDASLWFWRHVPLSKISSNRPHYLAIWSTNPDLTSSGTGPILAAGQQSGKLNAWLNRSIKGAAPSKAENTLEAQLSYFVPAMAIKLVQKSNAYTSPHIKIIKTTEINNGYEWEVQAGAVNFDMVLSEISLDRKNWFKFGEPVHRPPFIVTAPRQRINKEVKKLKAKNDFVQEAFLRITAFDEWGNTSSTNPSSIYLKFDKF